MKCSSCGEEMILGYIKCRDGLCFCEKPSPITAFPSLGKNAIPLGKEKVGLFSGGTITTAYRCPKCREVVIKY